MFVCACMVMMCRILSCELAGRCRQLSCIQNRFYKRLCKIFKSNRVFKRTFNMKMAVACLAFRCSGIAILLSLQAAILFGCYYFSKSHQQKKKKETRNGSLMSLESVHVNKTLVECTWKVYGGALFVYISG